MLNCKTPMKIISFLLYTILQGLKSDGARESEKDRDTVYRIADVKTSSQSQRHYICSLLTLGFQALW